MKINGSITMLFNQDFLRIEIKDENSSLKFLDINLPPKETMQAFSRLAEVPCEIELRGLEKIGKTMKIDKLEFEFPEYNNIEYKKRHEVAYNKALTLCPEGWEPDFYFGSQDSFFIKDNKQYAQCTIRKWE